mgnify:CR=1 FL=1
MKEALELRTVLDTMADGLLVIDEDHVIRRWNQPMTRLTGYTADEAIGSACTMLRGEDDACPHGALGVVDEGLSERGWVEGEEILIRRKDGARIPLLASARAICGEHGETLGAVVTFKDITRIRRLEDENRLLRAEARERASFHNLVGPSAPMQEVFRLIDLAAASDETILVLGETGTGKELVARAIHYHSARKDGPLVSVNCTALSPSLLESELFGHAKGAFTGAVRDYAGRFESAQGGTLFLDEVGELPPAVQVKLLRVLQEHSLERVGETRTRDVDVRIIAATHRDLRARVAEGAFRHDLFYRLNVFPLHIPPLRMRKEDIEPLLEHFLAQRNARTGKRLTGFTPEALRILMDHCWPGNVRELENAVAHAFVTCPGGLIDPLDLPVELRQVESRERICDRETGRRTHAGPAQPKGKARARNLNREQIARLLEQCEGNRAEAARRLGIDRTTLWRRMKALQMV